MSGLSWVTWLTIEVACLILGPVLDDLGEAIGRLAVQLCRAAEQRERKRERLAQLQFEFALARLQRSAWPSSASYGLAQHRDHARLRLGPP